LKDTLGRRGGAAGSLKKGSGLAGAGNHQILVKSDLFGKRERPDPDRIALAGAIDCLLQGMIIFVPAFVVKTVNGGTLAYRPVVPGGYYYIACAPLVGPAGVGTVGLPGSR